MFDKIQDAIDRKAARLTVSYDPEIGYPTNASIDYSFNMADEEFDFTATSYEPLDSAATDSAPPTTPIVSHGGPVNDYVSLVDNLRAAGATVDPAGNVSQPFFAPQGQLITVDGQDVQAFEFASAEEADAAAETVSADGGSVGTSMVGWVAPPHFYKAGKLIVIYVGSNGDVIDALQEALGPQFAGRER